MNINEEQEFMEKLMEIDDLFNNKKITSMEAFLLRNMLSTEKYIKEGGSYINMLKLVLERNKK